MVVPGKVSHRLLVSPPHSYRHNRQHSFLCVQLVKGLDENTLIFEVLVKFKCSKDQWKVLGKINIIIIIIKRRKQADVRVRWVIQML